MIRRPPRSTLFPYTTALPILRKLGAFLAKIRFLLLLALVLALGTGCSSAPRRYLTPPSTVPLRAELVRSEEHTSELQSRQYLVCRLLLEKKKTYTSLHQLYAT